MEEPLHLPEPAVEGCYFDDGFDPPLPAMRLRWPGPASQREWRLPGGLRLLGPPPARFGLWVRRPSPASYAVSLVWDGLCLRWPALTRGDMQGTAFSAVLAALGGQIDELLEQAVAPGPPPRAAA